MLKWDISISSLLFLPSSRGFSPFTSGVSLGTNVVVAIYGVLPLTYGDSPETDVVVAIYGVSPLSYGVSPETKRTSSHLWRFLTFFWRFARNKTQ